MAERLRLFVGFPAPTDLVEALDLAIRPLRNALSGVRWLARESLHLTLAFLGDTPRAALGELQRGLKEGIGSLRPARVRPQGWVLLPMGRPNVLALELEAVGPELGALVEGVEGVVRDLSRRHPLPAYHPRRGRFLPHVTVARFGREAVPTRAVWPCLEGEYTLDQVVIYESILGPGGSRYVSLASLTLPG